MSMVKVKTSELIGPALDWAVATAEGISIHALCAGGFAVNCEDYSPSTDWSQGGPLIEKYLGGCLLRVDELLLNAMRAIVLEQLGDVVSVPAEIVQEVSGGK